MASQASMLLNRRPQAKHRNSSIDGTDEEKDGRKDTKETARKPKRLSSFLRFRQRGAAWMNRKGRRKFILVIIFTFLVVLKWIIRPLVIKYFGGPYEMEGGELGANMDRRNRRFHRRRIEKRRRERLEELGIVLPVLDEARNEKYLTITSETLERRAKRKRKLYIAESNAARRQEHCVSPSASFQYNNTILLPRHILQPNIGPWFRPRDAEQMVVISFDEHDMLSLIRESFPSLQSLYDRSTVEGRFLLWSLCALYKYGGYIFGRNVVQVKELTDGVFNLRNTCNDVAAFTITTTESSSDQLDFLMLAACPRHFLLKCALDRLESEKNTLSGEGILKSLYSSSRWNSSDILRAVESSFVAVTNVSEVITTHCLTPEISCCTNVEISSSYNVEALQMDDNEKESKAIVNLFTSKESSVRHTKENKQRLVSPPTQVSITEQPNTPAPVKRRKVSVRNVMKNSHCDAGWRCNRCLHNPVYGSYETCESVCNDCFIDLICSEKHIPTRRTVTFDVVIRQYKNLMPGEQRIPRVVHQTWYEDLDVGRYPQLARVQTSWKNSGYEYRFYTDDNVREYIAANFPSRILDAYDSLVPGAFKADLFRSLVLLKEGGIYADTDVLLGANLDAFITPSMSFFVPLDLVGADYDEEFCLWNGLIGAAPGHPILVEAVEWLVNMVLNRADVYDFERELCRDGGKALQIWKIRQGRLLLLSGPCALGVAANRAAGKLNPVSRIESGWIVSERNTSAAIGDSLILKGDKFDMNAFRFTDVDRNLIVASTDMIDLTTAPLEKMTQDNLRKPAHYSETEAMDDVFGAKGVYADDLVTNEEIRLEVSREFME